MQHHWEVYAFTLIACLLLAFIAEKMDRGREFQYASALVHKRRRLAFVAGVGLAAAAIIVEYLTRFSSGEPHRASGLF